MSDKKCSCGEWLEYHGWNPTDGFMWRCRTCDEWVHFDGDGTRIEAPPPNKLVRDKTCDAVLWGIAKAYRMPWDPPGHYELLSLSGRESSYKHSSAWDWQV